MSNRLRTKRLVQDEERYKQRLTQDTQEIKCLLVEYDGYELPSYFDHSKGNQNPENWNKLEYTWYYFEKFVWNKSRHSWIDEGRIRCEISNEKDAFVIRHFLTPQEYQSIKWPTTHDGVPIRIIKDKSLNMK